MKKQYTKPEIQAFEFKEEMLVSEFLISNEDPLSLLNSALQGKNGNNVIDENEEQALNE